MTGGTSTTSREICWGAPTFELQAAPEQAIALLRKALESAPKSPRLLTRLAAAQIDRYDFVGAAATCGELLGVEPRDASARAWLAACLNERGRASEALDVLEAPELEAFELETPEASYQRAVALTELGRFAEAETQLRALLAAAPDHRQACGALMRLLRRAERWREALEACETLAAEGVGHAQLLLDWGYALAACGRPHRAGALMFDPGRLGRLPLPAPAPFADTAAFCEAFSDELSDHPIILGELGRRDANRGSRRVHQLLGSRRPGLVRSLAATLQALIDRFLAGLAASEDDPWLAARPRRARLNAWGLIQRAGEFEDWHSHPGGWLSGVCYLRLPARFSAEGDGAGCIEFGPPASLDPGLAPVAPLRIAPREGLVLLAPSHYVHRTIPFAADGERIGFAFDVAPDDR